MLGLLLNPVTLISFVLTLGILVFVHELGHFLVAKRLGIPVMEFGFGFPPRAWRFWRNEGWIEIQGRRLIVPRDFQLPEKLQFGSRVTYKSRRDDKGREVLSGIEMIDAESQGLIASSLVQAFDPGTEYTLNWVPLGGFVRMAGEDDPNFKGGFQNAKPRIRIPILLAGVTMNFILAYLIFSAMSLVNPPYAIVPSIAITEVTPDSPAALAGLSKGDLILAVNGKNLQGDFPILRQALAENGGRTVALTIYRNGKTLEPISVVPRLNPAPKEGALGVRLFTGFRGLNVFEVAPGSVAERAGIRPGDAVAFILDASEWRTPRDEKELGAFAFAHRGEKLQAYVAREGKLIEASPLAVQIPDSLAPESATLGLNLHISPLQAPIEGANVIARIVASVPLMFELIARVGFQDVSLGPIGIAQATGEIAQRGGIADLIQWVGLISLNLAIFNLLPIPPLDGGHLLFAALEWLRGGKRIDTKKQRLITEICVVLFIGLVVVISFADLQRVLAGRSVFPAP